MKASCIAATMSIAALLLLKTDPAPAGGEQRCRKVVITFNGRGYFSCRALGLLSQDDFNSPVGRQAQHYLTSDPVRGLLYIGSDCRTDPLSREDLASVPACLALEVFEVRHGDDGRYRFNPRRAIPIEHGTLHHLKLARNDPWNQKNETKTEFFADEGHSEGLHTEYFDASDVIGRELPAGDYVIRIIADEEKCGLKVSMNASSRFLKIHDPDTPALKALKLCHEGSSIKKNRSEDVSAWKEAISKKIMPALEIDPKSVCALNFLANYYWKIRKRKEFEKYFRASCEA